MRAIASLCLILAVWSADPLLAAPQEPTPSSGRWSDIQRLQAATKLLVAVNDAVAAPYTFLFADPSALFVLNDWTLARAGGGERDLRELVITNASALVTGSRAHFVKGSVRVGGDGVFVAGRKIADVSAVIERIERGDVREVRLARSRRRSSIATATGAAIGAGVGLALSATVFGCGSGCAEDWTRVFVLAGTGIGAAVGASVAAARPGQDERIIYST